MNIRNLLAILTMLLLLLGFLANSVMQRVIGPVEGSPLWPFSLLVIILAITIHQNIKIDRFLKSIGQ